MANDLNVVALVGRLTRESELRYSNGGMAICRFSIAVNRRKRTGDNWEDEASFFDCVLFGKSAENLNQYLEKGRQVSVQGELRQSRWESDGQTRSKVEIAVNSLQLLSSPNTGTRSSDFRRNGEGSRSQEYGSRQSAPSQGPSEPKPSPMDIGGPEQFDDDQIPF